MNYIILDLEWNSAYCKKCQKFINEIVQIGAVKLNEKLEFVDDITIMVHSQLTKRLSNRFKQLTNISNDEMLSGVYLPDAVDIYNAWAGNDVITLTWSTSDLYAIVENCRMFGENKIFKIGRYVDLQGYVQDFLHRSGHDFKGQISLKTAAEMIHLNTEGFELHTARDDSMLSAEILKKTYDKERLMSVSKDATTADFFNRLIFKPYAITSINDNAVDKDFLRFKCDKCGTYAKRKTKWVYKNHWFSANFKCRKCNNSFVGRLAFKKHYDYVVTKRLVLPIKKKGEINEQVQSLSKKV